MKRQLVTISMPMDLLERLKAIAFARSTPSVRITYADVLREMLEDRLATAPVATEATPVNRGLCDDGD